MLLKQCIKFWAKKLKKYSFNTKALLALSLYFLPNNYMYDRFLLTNLYLLIVISKDMISNTKALQFYNFEFCACFLKMAIRLCDFLNSNNKKLIVFSIKTCLNKNILQIEQLLFSDR